MQFQLSASTPVDEKLVEKQLAPRTEFDHERWI
jgi:hypothetical protein